MRNRQDQSVQNSLKGCLLGVAIGDALGLAYEGLSPKRAEKMLGTPNRFRFFFGRGMVSDDTEHSCMVLQAFIQSGGDIIKFQRNFSTRLRWWVLRFPAGVGKATAISCLRLWLGFKHPGIFSAGNGPAMRAPVLGALIDDWQTLQLWIAASSSLTHTDPKATQAAWALALAAWCAKRGITDGRNYLQHWLDFMKHIPQDFEINQDLNYSIEQAIASVEANESTMLFCNRMGWSRGVSGYSLHTVPAALHAWLSHPNDYPSAIQSMIQCGGDADTTAAIVGGIVGAWVKSDGIPKEWREGLIEYPCTVSWIEILATESVGASQDPNRNHQCPELNSALLVVRNLIFLAIVLFHGFRRLLPPY